MVHYWIKLYLHDYMGWSSSVSHYQLSDSICGIGTHKSRSNFQAGLTNGGPSGLIYGFLFAWLGTALQVLVMSELASM